MVKFARKGVRAIMKWHQYNNDRTRMNATIIYTNNTSSYDNDVLNRLAIPWQPIHITPTPLKH